MDAASAAIRSWRVLAAELDGAGAWHETAADRGRLAAGGKPVVLVVRIEGQLPDWDQVRLKDGVLGLLSRWRADGVPVEVVEIDHDCGTARLAAYGAFLGSLRAALPGDVRLSLTALPAWLGAPGLTEILTAADEAVLQVHAVADPKSGLFDAGRARRWMDAFGGVSGKPWRVALPAYGSKVTWDERGRIAAVDSERPSLVGGKGAAELMASPGEMAAFMAAVERDRPKGLAGIAWFRLPTDRDVRAWSLATWLAVVGRRPLRPHLSTVAQPAGQPGLYDLLLVSDGTTDAALPARIRLEGNCAAADGVNFYEAGRDAGGFVLSRMRDGLLRSGESRAVGWARCGRGAPRLHLE
jgi:hypothetical protein